MTRMRGISDSENKCSTMPCALCCNLIYSFSSYYNHTFALVFHVLHLQIKNCFTCLHLCLSRLRTQHACLLLPYYFLIRVWQTQKVVECVMHSTYSTPLAFRWLLVVYESFTPHNGPSTQLINATSCVKL